MGKTIDKLWEHYRSSVALSKQAEEFYCLIKLRVVQLDALGCSDFNDVLPWAKSRRDYVTEFTSPKVEEWNRKHNWDNRGEWVFEDWWHGNVDEQCEKLARFVGNLRDAYEKLDELYTHLYVQHQKVINDPQKVYTARADIGLIQKQEDMRTKRQPEEMPTTPLSLRPRL